MRQREREREDGKRQKDAKKRAGKKKKLMNKLVSCIFDHKINLFNCKYNIKLGIRWESEWRNEEYENRRWESEREGERVEKRRRNIFERDLHLHQTFVQLVDVSGFSLTFHTSHFPLLPIFFSSSSFLFSSLSFLYSYPFLPSFLSGLWNRRVFWSMNKWRMEKDEKEKILPSNLVYDQQFVNPKSSLHLSLPPSSTCLHFHLILNPGLMRMRRGWISREREMRKTTEEFEEGRAREREEDYELRRVSSTRKKSTPECINEGTKTSN